MSKLKELYSSKSFRESGHALIDLLGDYLEAIEKKSISKVIPFQEPDEAFNFWQNDFEKKEIDPISFFKTTIERSNHLHHPKYMGHQVSAPSPIAALSGVLTSVLNNGGAVYEMGLVNNPLEKVISKYLATKIGFDENADGFLTSGGTLANLTALLTARAKYSDVWENGTTKKMAVMVSEEAHYCIDRAARIMGLGTEGIIKVPINDSFQLKIDELQNHFDKAKLADIHVFAIIGSACSTATGSYDNLKAIGDFAEKNKIWFHVDGAHGGAVVFSGKYKYLVEGIEKSDSVAIDWHKMLLTPAITTSLIYRNGENTYSTFQQKAQYLWDNSQSMEWYNAGKRTFECTKLMMSVKVYTIIKSYGTSIFEENVNYLYDLAREFETLISENSNFEIALSPQSNIVCFRLKIAKNGLSINEVNSKIRRLLLEEGEFYIVQTRIKDKLYLRVSLMNPTTELIHLKQLLNKIEFMFDQKL